MTAQTRTLPEVLDAAFANNMRDVHTHLWGVIQSYDAALQRATVQIVPRRPFFTEDGERQTESYPILNDVPVWQFGSGEYTITTPITAGDVVLLASMEASLDVWLRGGQVGVDPDDDRRFSLNDIVAIPGGPRAFTGGPATGPISPSPPDDAMVLSSPTEVRIGSASASGAAVAESALADFMTALGAAILANPGPVATALGALQTALNGLHGGGGWQANTSKTKIE